LVDATSHCLVARIEGAFDAVVAVRWRSFDAAFIRIAELGSVAGEAVVAVDGVAPGETSFIV
jgi:hypothetical protein